MKAAGLRHIFQRHRMFRRPRCAEIIGNTADADHQRVIGHAAWGRNLTVFIVNSGTNQDFARLPVNADHWSEAVSEMVVMGLAEIMQLMPVSIQAAGGNGME